MQKVPLRRRVPKAFFGNFRVRGHSSRETSLHVQFERWQCHGSLCLRHYNLQISQILILQVK